jgi:tetratricopeptide (TPR) repeat protein
MAVDKLKNGNRALAARRLDEAEKWFREAIEESPSEVAAYRGLAKALEGLHRHEEIIAILSKAVCRIESPSLRKKLADTARTLVFRGEVQFLTIAIDNYEMAMAKAPDPVGFYYLGTLYADVKHDSQRAVTAYRRSLEIDPSSRTVKEALRRAESADSK